jgi:hypothetical protein
MLLRRGVSLTRKCHRVIAPSHSANDASLNFHQRCPALCLAVRPGAAERSHEGTRPDYGNMLARADAVIA